MSVPANEQVAIEVFDVTGKVIRTYDSIELLTGLNEFSIETTNLNPGIYMLRISGDEFSRSLPFVRY